VEAEGLDRVEHPGDHVRAVAVGELGDEGVHLLLGEGPVHERQVAQVAVGALTQ